MFAIKKPKFANVRKKSSKQMAGYTVITGLGADVFWNNYSNDIF